MIYNQYRFSSVHVGPTGHQHDKDPKAGRFEPMAIDCVECEPHLVREGWVYSPELVPMTDEQEREQERITREGNASLKSLQTKLAEAAAKAARDEDEDEGAVVLAPPLEVLRPVEEPEAAEVEAKPKPAPRRKAAAK